MMIWQFCVMVLVYLNIWADIRLCLIRPYKFFKFLMECSGGLAPSGAYIRHSIGK